MKAGEILIKYRKNQGMTVAKFAELLGVSQVFLTHLEHDKRKISENLFERLAEFLSDEEIKDLREAEKLKDIPKDIAEKLEKLEVENKNLKEKILNIDPRIGELDKRGLNQYEKTMNEASMFFNDEGIDEEDKQKLLLALNEVFFRSKEINKKKYAHKNKKNSVKDK
ncbi:helix-turn-helix domain-containing protein [Fusobacterium varium]|uniref:helix-turn-helix domain-containing protein n=1 Tax=Fusobacterium varium TaxID=856 RepID=UPI0022E3485F|nr:helix-turn-helix transcriptional regulator [Fusobacterium varium]